MKNSHLYKVLLTESLESIYGSKDKLPSNLIDGYEHLAAGGYVRDKKYINGGTYSSGDLKSMGISEEDFMKIPGANVKETFPWQAPMLGLNLFANTAARLKEDHEFKKYDNLQNLQAQQPEVTQLNRAYRYGTFEDGGSVGSLFDSALNLSKVTGMIPESYPGQAASVEPQVSQFTNNIVTGSPDIPEAEAADNDKALSDETSIVYNKYKELADKFLAAKGATGVTGADLARAAVNSYEKYGRTVPVELALAQLSQEGYLAKTKKPNKPQRTNNPFNVGNTDDGSTVTHSDVSSGIQKYYDLMAKSYLKSKSSEELLNNFTNSAGNRYASDKNYEKRLKEHIKEINKIIYK